MTNPLDRLLDTIDQVLDESWEDAARWCPREGWVDHDDDDGEGGPWFMEYDEDHPPPLITDSGVRWMG
ncbi:hypothetical protein [Mycobacteroides abscessus]|uniref:hypothetical protein n=1 Tax=Mycobacteroides abscessus TaxID=36809 RepID=UPI0019CFB523|nr:hypothetical protein [Mycobacteroides abscessus]MBN7457362.1 hypothetical protein [Mycobacteroides abscessus subsp. abscessus]